MKTMTQTLAAVLAGSFAAGALAEDREALLVNRNTTLNLIEALVEKGILDRKSADAMIRDAKAKAEKEAKEELAQEAAAKPQENPAAAAPAAKDKDGTIHVGYVPEFIQKQIHDKVRAELKDEVLHEVKQSAKKEQWKFADALPAWLNRITPQLDARLRVSDEFFGSDNEQFYDWAQINRDGGLSQALLRNTAYLNTNKDRLRINERFRLGLDAQITDGLKAGLRLTTTNIYSPVSTNQTLGNYNQTWIVALDRAYMQYDFVDSKGNDWFSIWGGRIANPFMSTEMMYSAMLSFEGIVGTFRWRFGQDDPAVASYRAPLATGRYGVNLGPQTPNTVFATAGVLPLQEVNFSSSDKWMFAAQAGADWLPFHDSRVKVAAAYYDFTNVRARRNSLDSNLYDWTAPQFMQHGNTLVAINDAINQTACNSGALGARNVCLVGLGSNFQVMDITAAFDYGGFAPTHVLLTLDYARNFGFDANYIRREFGDSYQARTSAYMARLDIGHPEVKHFNDWNVFFTYRYIESDAILDAFNDPIFHQGGTNTKGWTAALQYGIASNTWIDLRWLSSDVITGPAYSLDTLNLDLNAKF